MLPPGQKARDSFPRFGLTPYAKRFPTDIATRIIDIEIDGGESIKFDISLTDLPRTTIQADFHCVTTWSYLGATWSGVRFIDFYERFVRPLEKNGNNFDGAVMYAQDGYKTDLRLEDLLQEDVLIADTLDGQPLPIEHGAPLRLVAPKHYGYKNLKHLSKIKFFKTLPEVKKGISAFLDHPRARVNKEERSRWVPGWILRFVYRPLIPNTVKAFSDAMKKIKPDEPNTL